MSLDGLAPHERRRIASAIGVLIGLAVAFGVLWICEISAPHVRSAEALAAVGRVAGSDECSEAIEAGLVSLEGLEVAGFSEDPPLIGFTLDADGPDPAEWVCGELESRGWVRMDELASGVLAFSHSPMMLWEDVTASMAFVAIGFSEDGKASILIELL